MSDLAVKHHSGLKGAKRTLSPSKNFFMQKHLKWSDFFFNLKFPLYFTLIWIKLFFFWKQFPTRRNKDRGIVICRANLGTWEKVCCIVLVYFKYFFAQFHVYTCISTYFVFRLIRQWCTVWQYTNYGSLHHYILQHGVAYGHKDLEETSLGFPLVYAGLWPCMHRSDGHNKLSSMVLWQAAHSRS